MKKAIILSIVMLAGPAGSALADDVTDLLRKAYKDYTSGKLGEMTETLRDIVRLTDDQKEDQLAKFLPARIGDYLGMPLKSEHLSHWGGGLALERTYVHRDRMITVKIVKDSPLAGEVMKLLRNDDFVAWSGAKVHTISGEQGILDGKRKLMMVVGGETYLELSGNEDVRDADLVHFARKMDLRGMGKVE